MNGRWSHWGNWDPCNGSRTDGDLSPKYRLRTRNCTNPRPQNGGTKCDGSSVDVELCCPSQPGECVTVVGVIAFTNGKCKNLNFPENVTGSCTFNTLNGIFVKQSERIKIMAISLLRKPEVITFSALK